MEFPFPFCTCLYPFNGFPHPIVWVPNHLISALADLLPPHELLVFVATSSPMAAILHFLLRHGYPVLFGWVFLEQIGLPMPSAPVLLVAGALDGTGQLRFINTVFVAMMASLIADSLWFLWGRWRGAGALRLVCRVSLEPDTCVRRTKEAVARHGRLAILASKFVPGLNTAVPPLAGVSGMSLREFLALDGLSALLWAAAFAGLGRIFSRQLDALANTVRGFGGLILLLFAAGLAVYIARKFLARRKLVRSIWTERIDADELRRLIEEGLPVAVIDLRHQLDFQLHPFVIPGAVHFDPEELDRRYGEIPQDREVVVYCTCPNEATSARVALRLKQLGIERVRPLAGGLSAWRNRGFPMEMDLGPGQAPPAAPVAAVSPKPS
jgi:membrane protein DedA with SNARE-associated domain/rhodanese-related sulfurtransferase